MVKHGQWQLGFAEKALDESGEVALAWSGIAGIVTRSVRKINLFALLT